MRTFCVDETIADVLERATLERSSLTVFFDYNRVHPDELPSKYHDFPRTHVYLKRGKQAMEAQAERVYIGRHFFVHPTAGEVFYLRLQLHSMCPQSFKDLRAVESTIHPTPLAACDALGLLEDDREWGICFRDTAVSQTGYQLNHVYVLIDREDAKIPYGCTTIVVNPEILA